LIHFSVSDQGLTGFPNLGYEMVAGE